MKRYIITGAPGTGKTTLINALRTNNFYCLEEVSRKIIIAEQKNNGNKTPWQDVVGFTNLVYQKTIADLNILSDKTTFVDRGLADNIAYLKLHKLPISKHFFNFDYKKKYHTTVFVLPLWKAIYKEDPQRLQSFEEAKKLQELLLETYTNLGFSIYILPKKSVNKRVEFLKKLIKKQHKPK
ncbi:AAA family ATPase [Tenacibaculum pacificus]|uniref:AAA family ATPase n=1 Tax=Tenacibaculum pacificus TaxID=3018314 RepID=UPI0022F3CA51|nr:AAA family ATPase [Tenacibaculum pacificus]WBX74581.1 AAA family ATPase [Tenacibaculum pacificus]